MNHSWIPSSTHAGLPANAVYAGNDSDGSPIYVGRTHYSGDLMPAKIIPSKRYASVAFNGKEHTITNYEVLCGHGFSWIASSNGHVPAGAIVAGSQSNGEALYIGRGHHEGSLTPGKIHPSHGCLYIPYGMSERSLKTYEVLVGLTRSSWVSTAAHSPIPPGAILAGNDTDGSPIYVGKANHERDVIPAKVMPTKNVAYVAYNGKEIAKHQYEVLCNGNVSWVPSGHGSIPHNAVRGGQTSNGEALYVGRAHYNGSLTPGKVHPSHGTLYIPFGGSEIGIKTYEILIEN